MDRRKEDSRIATLTADVAVLKDEMRKNTEVTTQVRDILASFRILGVCAKWFAAIGAAATAAYHGWAFFRGE